MLEFFILTFLHNFLPGCSVLRQHEKNDWGEDFQYSVQKLETRCFVFQMCQFEEAVFTICRGEGARGRLCLLSIPISISAIYVQSSICYICVVEVHCCIPLYTEEDCCAESCWFPCCDHQLLLVTLKGQFLSYPFNWVEQSYSGGCLIKLLWKRNIYMNMCQP